VEFKLFDKPDYRAGRPGDAEWYREREVSDHINEVGTMHRGRLLEAADLVEEAIHRVLGKIPAVSDWGAGNGGLLNEIRNRQIDRGGPLQMWGYDLSPKAVEYARTVYEVDVSALDVVNSAPKEGDIVILTEFLEHLCKPHHLVKWIQGTNARFIVASSPCNENPNNFYIYHLWAWTGDSFAQMFERCGWRVLRHYVRADVNTQFILAQRS
jgi:hypothetical protein